MAKSLHIQTLLTKVLLIFSCNFIDNIFECF